MRLRFGTRLGPALLELVRYLSECGSDQGLRRFSRWTKYGLKVRSSAN